jgi:hypothetical protein
VWNLFGKVHTRVRGHAGCCDDIAARGPSGRAEPTDRDEGQQTVS